MKPIYKNIILALEIHPKVDKILVTKAQEFVKDTGAKLTLVHAIEHIGTYSAAAYGIVNVALELEEAMIARATKEMTKLGNLLDVPVKRQIIKIDSAKVVIIEEAKKCKADLIIMGSRGKGGLTGMLLGSTANAVLHHAPCDVLAIRVK